MGGEGDDYSFGFFYIPGRLSGAEPVAAPPVVDYVCVAVAAALLTNSWWRLTIVWNE